MSVCNPHKNRMRAAVYREYGPPDVIELTEVPKPEPAPDQILIDVVASTVNTGDCRIRSLDVPEGFSLLSRFVAGVFEPRNPILGMELSGIVEATGSEVTEFDVGDEVYAFPENSGHAEYAVVSKAGKIARKPSNLSFEEAAAIPFGGTAALDFLRDRADVCEDDRVLVHGASGTVGSAAVQLANYFGAEVTGVASTENLELVESLGADRVIDYTREDWRTGPDRWDIIFDAVGNLSLSNCESSLAEEGRLLLLVGSLGQVLTAPLVSRLGNARVAAGMSTTSGDDLDFLATLSEEGQFTPVLDRHYVLEDIVDAHERVESGEKTGTVVVRVR